MKHPLQRMLAKGFRTSRDSLTDFALSPSQEHLLPKRLAEKEHYLFEDKKQTEQALSKLPDDIILRIASLLNQVSRLCLKYTNKRFRETLKTDDVRLSQCVNWLMLARLERDLLKKGEALPDRLACRYCKQAHPKEDFGVRNGNVGYGIERLEISDFPIPEMRFCWRYIPRLLLYGSDVESEKIEQDYPKPLQDTWTLTRRWTCLHCNNELTAFQAKKLRCPICEIDCEVCRPLNLPYLQRLGPKRLLESYANIRFVRRTCTGGKFEVRDLNGIRHPERPLPKEPREWRQGSIVTDLRKHIRIAGYLIHRYRVGRNRFSLYSPYIPPGRPLPLGMSTFDNEADDRENYQYMKT